MIRIKENPLTDEIRKEYRVFKNREELFPITKNHIFLSHSSVSPLYGPACDKLQDIAEQHKNLAVLSIGEQYETILNEVRAAAASLLKAPAHTVAFLKNTSEGMGMIANGYPLQPGDEIITYEHEYPANYYPWKLQEKRGARLVLLPNKSAHGEYGKSVPGKWTIQDLEERVTEETKIFAISHVQFTSGFTADLEEVGNFCKKRNIDLIVDAAQSLGALPLYPERDHLSAVVSSGWKWLLGPVGTGIMYTSDALRNKLDHVMVGAELMSQGLNYLDHTWNPVTRGKRFEYSTSPLYLAAALTVCINEVPLHFGIEKIRDKIFQLQDVFLEHLDGELSEPLLHEKKHRSGILSLLTDDPDTVAEKLLQSNIVCTARGGLLRIAPHCYNSSEELRLAAETLNAVVNERSMH